MKDQLKTKQVLIQELASLKQKIAELEQSESVRKRDEETLRESEERFTQMAEQAREMIWEVNDEGLYTYVSRGCELITGYNPDEIVEKRYFYDLHPEEGRESFKKAAFEVFERKERFHELLNAVLTKDGREVWVSTNGIPILDSQGNLLATAVPTTTSPTANGRRRYCKRVRRDIDCLQNIRQKPFGS